jgi:signal transduction histidine kinase
MPALVFEVPEDRAGSAWLAREGSALRNEMLVALFSRFNHDLRTPLNTIMGWTHLLQQGMVDSSRSKHVADVLARNTHEQVVLLDEFVDDGRAVLGVMKLDLTGLRIGDLVAQAVERAAPVARLHGVSFNVRPDHGIGGIEGDERRLQRLVYRLLVAVTRRTRQGSVIELSSCLDDGSAVLSIEGPVADGDWPDAALLDLRISSFVTALHGAELAIDGAPERAAVALRLPARP